MDVGALFRRLINWVMEVTNSPAYNADLSRSGNVTPLLFYAITICSLANLSVTRYPCA